MPLIVGRQRAPRNREADEAVVVLGGEQGSGAVNALGGRKSWNVKAFCAVGLCSAIFGSWRIVNEWIGDPRFITHQKMLQVAQWQRLSQLHGLLSRILCRVHLYIGDLWSQ